MSEEKIAFRPVKCTEQKLKTLNPINGYVYFTTDTGKIFLGQDGKLQLFGESNSFFYGQKNIEYDNTGVAPDPNVNFYLEEIETEILPEKNDLILNIDGCFYRVIDILDESTVKTTRLTLQGTGVGGGTGGGGDLGAPSFILNIPSGTVKYFSSESKKATIDFMGRSSDSENLITSVECSYDKNFTSNFYSEFNLKLKMEIAHEVDLTKYLNTFSSTGTKIYLRVTDSWGTVRSTSYTVYLANLQITSNMDELFGVLEDSFDYSCKIGGSQGVTNRNIKYSIYNSNNIEIFNDEKSIADNESGTILKTLSMITIPHGDYTLYVQMTGQVGSLTLSSNVLIHKILRYQDEVGQPILSALIPETTEQYTNIPIKYLLVYGDTSKKYQVDFVVNDKVETTQEIETNVLSSYNLSFESTGTYALKLNIESLGIEYTTELIITKYTGVLPVINVDRDDLKLYLTAKGKTNNSADKNIWADYKNDSLKGALSDFYFRTVNGWMEDEDGISYLKLSQGAKFELEDYTPFGGNPTQTGLTIELDFSISTVQDYDANLLQCLSYKNDGSIWTGFEVKGDSFKYYASETNLMSLDLVENQRIRLSYVIEPKNVEFPMCYTYLNGKISNVYPYAEDDNFINSGIKGYIKADSTYGEINIYNIRIYNSALDASIILNNYQATLSSLEERQKSYEENLILDIDGDIDLNLIEKDGYNLKIPYVKITGGYSAAKDMTMADKSSSNIPSLPVGKKDYRSIDMEVHYPTEQQNPYFKGYEDFTITTKFSEGEEYNVTNGFGLTPIEGAIMYAQGTSSLEYPVKNLRVKMKGKKIKVKPDLEPVNLICFKADYMESSGSHNTGAANFIDTAYKYIDISTPGQNQFANENIVTCIKGHPCVIFWSPTGEEGTYKYIGKYNLNLDKATPEPFGFKYDELDEKFGYETDIDGNLILDDEGNKKNSIYCFEFLDNNTKVCNFLSDKQSNENENLINEIDRYRDTWYGDRLNEDNKIVPGWAIGFESRYPEDKVGLNDADALWPLASWLNELYKIRYLDNDEETALNRFKEEYWKYLDEEFLLAYYVITEALLMADSRVKNMMIATWGKELRTNPNDESETNFGYIWYPIFYDMDTMLGLDNTGHVNKFYYDEDTQEDVFNGDEILWKFVRDALPNKVAQFYTRMEQASGILTKNGIIPYFNENQANMANEIFYNKDAEYKYVNPYRTGYQDHLNDQYIQPGTGERLYAAQGDRSMMREYFIENRIKYLRGKYSSTAYQGGDRIEMRLTYPKVEIGDILTEEQQKINASIIAVPPSGDFNYISKKTGYAGVKIGKNSTPVNHRFVNEEEYTITLDTSGGNGTECYFLGLSNLSSIGDLSNKYLYNLIVGTSENNLKSFILGNHHKDYYNPYWKDVTSAINLAGFKSLEEFSLENCSTFSRGVILSDCTKIKKILLNGSSISSLTLPVGGVIEELRLPSSLSIFKIDSHAELSDKFTLGYFDYDTDTYVDDFSGLVQVSIKDTPIDSYKIAKETILLPETRNLTHFCFQGINWEITDINDVELNDKGQLSGIKILDKLLEDTLYPYTGIATKEEALTGTIYINLGNIAINEYDLYQKYHANWPNITITYDQDNPNLIKASTINFYNSEVIKGEPYYSVKSNGEISLINLTNENSPLGEALTTPVKVSDNVYTYRFIGAWKVAASEDEDIAINSYIWQDNWMDLYVDVDSNVASELESEFDSGYVKKIFSQVTPKDNISLVPIYTSDERLYDVTLIDEDKSTILLAVKLPWGADIGKEIMALKSSNENYYKVNYNYKEYTGEEPHYRYTFKGWQSGYDKNNENDNITYPTLDGVYVQNDFTVYAYYVLEDARNTATDLKYFSFGQDTYIYKDGTQDSGLTISINSDYWEILQGKITLPSKHSNGNYIKFISTFRYNPNITDVYFLDDNQYAAVTRESFRRDESDHKLANIYLPKTPYFKAIGDRAFFHCTNLYGIDINNEGKLNDEILEIGDYAFGDSGKGIKIKINELPKKLIYLGGGAFTSSANNPNPNITITSLPEGLTELQTYSLAYCPNANISVFGSETEGKGLQTIHKVALQGSGSLVTQITIMKSITKLSSANEPSISFYGGGAFYQYASKSLTQFISYKSYSEIVNTDDEPLTSWAEIGIPEDKVTEIVQY